MKRLPLTISLLSVAVLATSSLAEAQERRATPPKQKADATSVGLIDMAHVFQNYEKFKELRKDLQAAVLESDSAAKEMAQQFQNLQQKLAAESKELDPGSPEHEAIHRRLLEEKSKFEAWRAATQSKLAGRETEMLKVIYADVSKMVKLYADYAQYSLVLRFNSKGVEDDMQPQQAIQAMNKNVIYYQTGNDITEPVLRKLNSEYAKSSGSTSARSVGTKRRVTQ